MMLLKQKVIRSCLRDFYNHKCQQSSTSSPLITSFHFAFFVWKKLGVEPPTLWSVLSGSEAALIFNFKHQPLVASSSKEVIDSSLMSR
ncbi:unnamed protein product [Blepharisma stoltei]|uniref:Uncharacterized protein n=1 Tax=Blepharisma stoltei TaxID=1481888 RepID=A0AAU9JJX5_9CILI|nr:unnamed protein product [Blepharisma stoltei]